VIKTRYGVDATLIRGSGGIYDIKKDGKLVFSKHQLKRFPDSDEEVFALIDG
jgi:predicted Rdx family selenoprotein